MLLSTTEPSKQGRFHTEGRLPMWYRPSLSSKDDRPSQPAKRMFIGSGEDCMVDELKDLILENVC